MIALALAALLSADSSIVLRWKPVEDAVFYDLEIATDKTFKDVVLSVRIAQNGYRWEALPDRVHYFRARGLDEGERPGPWSEIKEIAPVLVTPALLKPKKNAVFVNRGGPERVEFHFELAPLFATYTVQVATDEKFNDKLFEEKATASPIIFQAKGLGVYFYRFFATTADDHTTQALTSSFSVGLAAPELLTPDGMNVVVGGSVPLQWNKVRGATKYRVQVMKVESDTEVLNERTQQTEDVFTPKSEGHYTWRVYSEDDRGRRHGPSQSRTFTVVAKQSDSVPTTAPAGPAPFMTLRVGMLHGAGFNFVASGSLHTAARAALGLLLGPGRLFVELDLGLSGYNAGAEAGLRPGPGVLAFPLDPAALYEFQYREWRFFGGVVFALRPLAGFGAATLNSGIAVGIGGTLGFGYNRGAMTATFELRLLYAPVVLPTFGYQTGGMVAAATIWYDLL